MTETPDPTKAPRLGRRSISVLIEWLNSIQNNAKISQLLF